MADVNNVTFIIQNRPSHHTNSTQKGSKTEPVPVGRNLAETVPPLVKQEPIDPGYPDKIPVQIQKEPSGLIQKGPAALIQKGPSELQLIKSECDDESPMYQPIGPIIGVCTRLDEQPVDLSKSSKRASPMDDLPPLIAPGTPSNKRRKSTPRKLLVKTKQPSNDTGNGRGALVNTASHVVDSSAKTKPESQHQKKSLKSKLERSSNMLDNLLMKKGILLDMPTKTSILALIESQRPVVASPAESDKQPNLRTPAVTPIVESSTEETPLNLVSPVKSKTDVDKLSKKIAKSPSKSKVKTDKDQTSKVRKKSRKDKGERLVRAKADDKEASEEKKKEVVKKKDHLNVESNSVLPISPVVPVLSVKMVKPNKHWQLVEKPTTPKIEILAPPSKVFPDCLETSTPKTVIRKSQAKSNKRKTPSNMIAQSEKQQIVETPKRTKTSCLESPKFAKKKKVPTATLR